MDSGAIENDPRNEQPRAAAKKARRVEGELLAEDKDKEEEKTQKEHDEASVGAAKMDASVVASSRSPQRATHGDGTKVRSLTEGDFVLDTDGIKHTLLAGGCSEHVSQEQHHYSPTSATKQQSRGMAVLDTDGKQNPGNGTSSQKHRQQSLDIAKFKTRRIIIDDQGNRTSTNDE